MNGKRNARTSFPDNPTINIRERLTRLTTNIVATLSDHEDFHGDASCQKTSTYPDAGHIHLSQWLDWEPIQSSPLSFDNILATGGASVIGKLRVNGCDGEQLYGKSHFCRRGGGRW